MAESFLGKCAKAFLFAFNFLFWLTGVALIVAGAWVLIDEDITKYLQVLYIQENVLFLERASYLLIIIGVFIMLIGFAGCCGAMLESKFLLILYSVLLAIIICLEVIAGILAHLFRREMENFTKEQFKNNIHNHYTHNNTFGVAWNFAQHKTQPVTQWPVPWSCCRMRNSDPQNPQLENAGTCLQEAQSGTTPTQQLYTTGCLTALAAWARSQVVWVIGVGAGMASLQLFGLIAAIYLIHRLKQEMEVGAA